MSTVPAQSRNNGEDDSQQTDRPDLTVVSDTATPGYREVELDVVGEPATDETVVSHGVSLDKPERSAPKDDTEVRVDIDIIEDDPRPQGDSDGSYAFNRITDRAEAAPTQLPRLVRWYMQYFWALIRYVTDSRDMRNRLARKYFEGHLFTHSDTLGGVIGRDRSICVTIEHAEKVIDECLAELQNPYYRTGDFNNVVPRYTNLVLLNELSIDMPGRPSVGPWWLFPLRPLLRVSAFSWLNRQFQVYLNNAA